MSDAYLFAPPTSGEQGDNSSRLWHLLAEQTAKYTSGESSSVPVETARELLASLLYTLSLSAQAENLAPSELPEGELWAAVRRGRRLLSDKTARTKKLWSAACATAPAIPNVYYGDTLRGIGEYLNRYDLLYFAHRVPDSIDYPLIAQPPESLQGMTYTEEYLKNMLEENLLLRHFDPALVTALLGRSARAVEGSYRNLCEQPLINALGRAALGKSALPLDINCDERSALFALLRGAGGEAVLSAASDALCRELNMGDAFTRGCLAALLRSLAPRLRTALDAGDLTGVFPSLF